MQPLPGLDRQRGGVELVGFHSSPFGHSALDHLPRIRVAGQHAAQLAPQAVADDGAVGVLPLEGGGRWRQAWGGDRWRAETKLPSSPGIKLTPAKRIRNNQWP